MNFFTPEWHRGDAEEHPAEKYQEHLAPLLSQWPSDVQTLAARINLHDGLIRELSWNTDEATLFLDLRCGDNQLGYFDLDLHYFGVLFSPLEWACLLTLNANKNGSALYDEVDEEDGRFVHRILFMASRRVRRPRRYRVPRQMRVSRRSMVSRAAKKFRYHELIIRFEKLRLVTAPCGSRFDTRE